MLKDTEQLTVESTLPVLAFDFEGLKTWAEGLAQRYADLVVTEDAIADVKRDMAELNKTKKAVDDARKEAIRRVSEPIRAFESQIKEVCGIFDTAYAKLGNQVRAFEDAQREEKRKVVQEIIKEESAAAYGEGPWLNIPVQDSWLNKTTSLKTVREAVAGIIEKDLEEERRRKALEQARQDRAAAIERHVKALNEKHGLNLPIHRFMTTHLTDMNVSLDQAYSRIDDVFTGEVELRLAEESARRALASVSEQKEAPIEQAAPKIKRLAPKPATRAMSVVLEYAVANEAAVKSCLENLKTLCVNFGARYR